jgi:hypothetical protein
MTRLAFVLPFLICFSLSQSTSAKETRIKFKRGATRATVYGWLNKSSDEACFVLNARAGQPMRIIIKGKGATRGTVIFPSGKADGQPGGVIFDDVLDETGDYRIRVTESQMAATWRGRFTLKVEIE